MAPTGRYFNTSRYGGDSGPSDEMLAIDAAGEMRSFTLLYERYADRLYRYFLVCTGDPQRADRLLRSLLSQLPGELQRYRSGDRSFAGWLFARSSRRMEQDVSPLYRIYHRIFDRFGGAAHSREAGWDLAGHDDGERLSAALGQISDAEREVLGVHLGAGLSTVAASDALRLPPSLLSSHIARATRSLGSALGSSASIDQLSDELRAVFSAQRVTDEQRREHLDLIFALFHGEELAVDGAEAPQGRSGMAREIAAIAGVAVLAIVAVWVWSVLTPSDSEAEETPSTSIEIASQPDSTPTPAATPEPETGQVEIASDSPDVCLASNGKLVFDTFVYRFNDGDFEGLASMLPSSSYEHPLFERNDMEANPSPHEFFRHQDMVLSSAEDILDYLQDRHAAGERWRVVEAYPAEHYRNWQEAAPLEMYLDWKREHPGLGMIVVASMNRSAADFHTHSVQGRAIVDCDQELIIDWSLRPNESIEPDPVAVDEFLVIFEPLAEGEERETRVLVSTDVRSDGGAMSNWDLRWRQAVWHDGTELERVDVRTLDGYDMISYVSDGDRWRLDQRGWVTYGRNPHEDPPEEIALALPVIEALPDALRENLDVRDVHESATISLDLTFADMTTTQWIEVDIEAGILTHARMRETNGSDSTVRSDIQFLSVVRADRFDPGDFAVSLEPRFPELEVDAPRYRVPEQQWRQLSVVEMKLGDDAAREEYRLSWDDVEFNLIVMPSRGGLDPNSVPEGVDESWSTAIAEYAYGQLAWAHRHFAGYPTDAIWDDGRYRFELSVDRDAISTDHEWSLGRLIDLANALSEPNVSAVADRQRYQDRNS